MSLPEQTPLIHKGEWENLIILDACRFDAFEMKYSSFLEGDLIKVRSPASCTRDWLRLTWTQDSYEDLTYISSNMFMQSKHTDHPCQFEDRHKFKEIVDVFLDGIEPELVCAAARMYPGRKVIHFDQPHKPCLGVIKEEGWEGYLSNLEHVLGFVVDLLPDLEGRTVITADHGEWFLKGEMLHPCSKDMPILREVPWMENVKVKE